MMSKSDFINEFISAGLYEYYTLKSTNSFESHIIECLTDIYGTDIQKNYEENNTDAFEQLIKKYGIKPSLYDSFLRDTAKYEVFKKENLKDPRKKSNIASIIEVNIIMMYLQKSIFIEPTMEEISHFENDLLNNFSIVKLHFNISLEPNRTREYWNRKKRIIFDNVELKEIKPNYLDNFTYARYGINIDDVKKMDYRMVDELNSVIQGRIFRDEPKDVKVKPKWNMNTAISTGNGAVDAILMVAIIAAELSIGLIYLFLHM